MYGNDPQAHYSQGYGQPPYGQHAPVYGQQTDGYRGQHDDRGMFGGGGGHQQGGFQQGGYQQVRPSHSLAVSRSARLTSAHRSCVQQGYGGHQQQQQQKSSGIGMGGVALGASICPPRTPTDSMLTTVPARNRLAQPALVAS